MKTIRQIAEEIGFSKQAVFYQIKKPPLSCALQSLSSKGNAFFDGGLMELLCDTVYALKEELKEKNKQISDLTAIVKIQAENANKRRKFRANYNKKPKKKTSVAMQRLIDNAST